MSAPDELRLQLEERPTSEDLETLERGLIEHARDRGAEPRRHRILAVFARGRDGRILGGLRGATAWSWLHVKHLWVSSSHRGRGVGTRLVRAAELEAAERGCDRAWLDTFDFQAVGFYEKLGYREFGRLEDYPPGSARVFLWKRGLKGGREHMAIDSLQGAE